jgi:bifunctional non-homologous end joining protein LigD
MLVSTGVLPDHTTRVAVEPKWDGVRCLAYVTDGQLRLESRRGRNITTHVPELQPLGRALGDHAAVLDGELVAMDGDGRPDFYAVLRRLTLSRPLALAWAQRQTPLTFLAFDLLWLDDHSVVTKSYEQRRVLLDSLHLSGPAWHTTPRYSDDADDVFAACDALGLEGIVIKTLDSPYRPGQRTRSWIKHKTTAWRSTHEQRRRPHFERRHPTS